MPYGRTLLSTNQLLQTRVSADGMPNHKAGGATIDWANTVTALGSDTTYPDGSVVRSGQKVLRYGQVVCKITGGTSVTTQTLTAGTATGGTFTLTLARPDTGTPVTTGTIAFNATAAAVLAAIQAVLNPGQAVSSSGGPLGTGAVTVVFGSFFPAMTVNGAALTGGTAPAVAVTNVGASSGFFGPYDPAASDGRQTLTRGECFVCDETILQFPGGITQLAGANDQVGSLIEGGLIDIDKIIQSGTAAHTLALGPTKAEFLAAFPMFRFVEN